MKTFVKIIAWFFVSVLIIFIGLIVYIAVNFGPETTTDVDDYRDLRDETFGDSILVKHFPRSIPANATNVHLSYSSKFLQGGGHLQLRFNLPEKAYKKAISPFLGKELLSFKGGNSYTYPNVPTTRAYTFSESLFTDDFSILLLYIRPSLEEAKNLGPDFYWNHGENYGVAHSDDTNTIIYWAEFW